MAVTIAGRSNVSQEVQKKSFTLFSFQYRQGIFRHLLLKQGDICIPLDIYGAIRADQDAFAATHTFFLIDLCLVFFEGYCLVRAVINAIPAANALFPFDLGTKIGVLFKFPFPRSTSHSDIFDCSTET